MQNCFFRLNWWDITGHHMTSTSKLQLQQFLTFRLCNYSIQWKSGPASQPPSSSGVRPQTFKGASQQGHDWHGVCAAGKHNRPCSQPEGKYQTPRGIKTSRDTRLTIQGKHTLSEVWSHCDNNHHDHGDCHLSSIIIHHHNQSS